MSAEQKRLNREVETLKAAAQNNAAPVPNPDGRAPGQAIEEDLGLITSARGLIVELAGERGAKVEDLHPKAESTPPDPIGPAVDNLRIKKGDRLLNASASTQCTFPPTGVLSATAKVSIEIKNAFDDSVVGTVNWSEGAVAGASTDLCDLATRRALKKIEGRLGAILDRGFLP
jgi:hypothetical protein